MTNPIPVIDLFAGAGGRGGRLFFPHVHQRFPRLPNGNGYRKR